MSIGVYEKNKGVIDPAKNPLISCNDTHIDVQHNFPSDMAAGDDIFVKCLRSEDQHADILTKAIGRETFERQRDSFLSRSWVSVFSWFTSRS